MRSYTNLLNVFGSEFSLIILRMLSTIYIAKKFGLSILGTYSTLMSWASILSLFAVFGGYNLIQKNSGAENYNSIIKISSITSLIGALIFSYLVVFSIFKDEFYFAFCILFFETINLSLRSISKAFLYSENKISFLAVSNFLIAITYAVLLAILIFLMPTNKTSIIYFVISYNLLSFSFFGYGILKRCYKAKINFFNIKTYFQEATSYFVSSSLRNLYQQLDKILVNIFFKSEISGLYNLCSRFAVTALLPANTFIQSIESNFYRKEVNGSSIYTYFKNRKNIATYINVICSIASLLPAFLILNYLGEVNNAFELYFLFVPLIVMQGYLNVYLSLLNGQGFKLERIKLLLLLNIFLIISVYISSFLSIYWTPILISFINCLIILYMDKMINVKSQ